jgi:putative transcriptional regulator
VASVAGKLLVAAPTLEDPNFARTVVAIADHGDHGALGVVLNRLSDAEVAEAVPDLAEAAGPDAPVFVGGPVSPQGIVVLAEFDDPAQAAFVLVGRVGLVAETTDVGELADVASRCRVFAGYAGWGPGQLDDELEREDWIVAPAQVQDVFSDRPADLWSTVLERLGGTYRLVARMPLDPTLN